MKKEEMSSYLRRDDPEVMPSWLAEYRPGGSLEAGRLLGSRLVFYPGSGTDGQAVKIFGGAGAAHVFVYADFGMQREEVERQLELHPFLGYRRLGREELKLENLCPQGWRQHLGPQDLARRQEASPPSERQGYGFVEILEREEELGEAHGVRRLAIFFLGADGIATFDALFCQDGQVAPFAILLQDHGFGDNYSSFGADGLLHLLALRCGVWPKYLLIGHATRPWPTYHRLKKLKGQAGGMHNFGRTLYLKNL